MSSFYGGENIFLSLYFCYNMPTFDVSYIQNTFTKTYFSCYSKSGRAKGELFQGWRRKTSMKLEDCLYYKFCENYDLQQTK